MEKMELNELGDQAEDLTAAARHLSAREVSARTDCDQRSKFCGSRDGDSLRCGIGRQRAHVRFSAQSADQPCWH